MSKEFRANQYVSDPRQSKFLEYYLSPESKTYSNAYRSAIKAGYAEEYAQSITALEPKWLSEGLGKRKKLLVKAENNLKDLLETEDIKVKADITKFVAKTLGKKDYGDKEDKETPQSITFNIVNYHGDKDTI